ncbi:MAG: DegT/DnrJ/EryC1/StrS family aminotransferase [Phycisphaerae bacterium]
MNPVVQEFERAFAQQIGHEYAKATWKGRVALYAILRAMGIQEGDEIILPGYTCVMNVNPIMYLGATPVYADIDPVTYNIRPERLEEKISSRTRAIIAQHTYGYPCEMDDILAVAGRHGIPVLEDCCLALGSRYKGKLCGTFGHAAYWSFQWNKPFTTGIGGVAATSDSSLAAAIEELCEREMEEPSPRQARLLAMQRLVYRAAIYPKTNATATRLFRWLTRKGIVVGSSSTAEFDPAIPAGFFTSMGPGQARAGLRQLGQLERNLTHRREMAQLYDQLLRESGWDLPNIQSHMDPVLVRYPLRISDKARAVTEAPSAYVELGTWFECPLHPMETPMEKYGYRDGMCPVAEEACREVVNLPTHPRANSNTARRTVAFIQSLENSGTNGSEGQK